MSAYMWNLERWYRRTCLQSRDGDADVETNVWIPRREGGVGWDDLGVWD